MNEFAVMNKRMLSRKVETIRANTCCPKNFTIMMKSLKRIVQGYKTVCVMNVTSSYVTKFQERANRFHHFTWYMTFDCWKINL